MKNWYAVEVCGILLPTLAVGWIRNGIECLTFYHRLSRCESLWSSYTSSSGPSGGGGTAPSRWGSGFGDEGWLTSRPSYTIIGGVVAGAGWYLYRLARGPEGPHFFLPGSRSFGNAHG